jgi:hypothetical protein
MPDSPWREIVPGARVVESFDTGAPISLGGGVYVAALSNGMIRLRSGDDPFEYFDLEPDQAHMTIRALCDALELVTRPKKR